MSDGLVWLLVGALVPLLGYTMVGSVRKPNLFVLLVLGIGGAIVGGPLGEMVRPEADVFGVSGVLGAAAFATVFTAAYRVANTALNAPVERGRFADAPAHRTRTI